MYWFCFRLLWRAEYGRFVPKLTGNINSAEERGDLQVLLVYPQLPEQLSYILVSVSFVHLLIIVVGFLPFMAFFFLKTTGMNTAILDRRSGKAFKHKAVSDPCADKRLMLSLWRIAIKNYYKGSNRRQQDKDKGTHGKRRTAVPSHCCIVQQ